MTSANSMEKFFEDFEEDPPLNTAFSGIFYLMTGDFTVSLQFGRYEKSLELVKLNF